MSSVGTHHTPLTPSSCSHLAPACSHSQPQLQAAQEAGYFVFAYFRGPNATDPHGSLPRHAFYTMVDAQKDYLLGMAAAEAAAAEPAPEVRRGCGRFGGGWAAPRKPFDMVGEMRAEMDRGGSCCVSDGLLWRLPCLCLPQLTFLPCCTPLPLPSPASHPSLLHIQELSEGEQAALDALQGWAHDKEAEELEGGEPGASSADEALTGADLDLGMAPAAGGDGGLGVAAAAPAASLDGSVATTGAPAEVFQAPAAAQVGRGVLGGRGEKGLWSTCIYTRDQHPSALFGHASHTSSSVAQAPWACSGCWAVS